jgi:hypothetical protein
MSPVQAEIAALEARLREAELGPDPGFFEDALADDAVLVAQDGRPSFAKAQVIQAHQPGRTPKFTRVDMHDLVIVDHGTTAVVTCVGTFEGPHFSGTLRFLRVWVKKGGRWQIVAASISN